MLPRSQMLYSLPSKLLKLLRSEDRMRSTVFEAKHGMNTFNNFRFLRLRWEVPVDCIGENLEWEPLSKGGPYAVYYSDLPLIVRWNRNGDEIAEENRRANGQTAQARQASNYYRLPGATYSRRSSKNFGVRMLPSDCIIGEKGPAVLATGEYSKEFIIALLNSRLMNFLVHVQSNAKQYDSGILERLPWIPPSQKIVSTLETLCRKCIGETKAIEVRNETDTSFAGLAFAKSLSATMDQWVADSQRAQKQISEFQTEIDELVDSVYEIDSRELRQSFLDVPSEDNSESTGLEDDEDDETSGSALLSVLNVAQTALSVCVGCILKTLGHTSVYWITFTDTS